MKTLFITPVLSVLLLTACGKSGSSGAVPGPTPAPNNPCVAITMQQRGWGYNNPGGIGAILNDCGNGVATFTVQNVLAQGNPSSGSATNGMTFSAKGLCDGQPGAFRTATFSELYFVFGQNPSTFFTTTTGGVEDLAGITDGNIYTISDIGYSCKVSFVNGVITYH